MAERIAGRDMQKGRVGKMSKKFLWPKEIADICSSLSIQQAIILIRHTRNCVVEIPSLVFHHIEIGDTLTFTDENNHPKFSCKVKQKIYPFEPDPSCQLDPKTNPNQKTTSEIESMEKLITEDTFNKWSSEYGRPISTAREFIAECLASHAEQYRIQMDPFSIKTDH